MGRRKLRLFCFDAQRNKKAKNQIETSKNLLTIKCFCDIIVHGLKEPVPKTAGASGLKKGETPENSVWVLKG